MKTILIVDDEPAVLDGLRDVLWHDRAHFKVLSAGGGVQAVEMLADHPIDILVTDMRMPTMGGLELLEHVREFYPEVVRLSLSGYSDDELVARASGVAHQQLAKPCSREAFRAALQQAGALHELLGNAQLRRLIGTLGQIPTTPATYAALTRALDHPNISFPELARIIERDLGVSARILKLVNSAYYERRRTIGDIAEAIPRLGLSMLRHLVLSVEVGNLFPAAQGAANSLDHHAVLCAHIARRLVAPDQADLAFAYGLLHDIGRHALAARIPARYAEVVSAALSESRPLSLVEQESLGADHAEVGAYLLGLWGLPADILQATRRHHDGEVLPPSGTAGLSICDAVRVAHLLAAGVNSERTGAADPLAGWRALALEQAASLGTA
jgi:HD-like signal output (HDOD) protein/CheY-like chemotaxis protein